MPFDKNHIKTQLDKILADKSFARSKTNCRLLTFLVSATLEGDDVKEATIGKEFFGANYDPVKSDNNVRVYIYHLRKKLDAYYSTKASPDEIVFSIAKGQYNVQFEKYQKPANKSNVSLRHTLIIGSVLITALLITLLYQKPVNNFWSTLMHNDFSTTVIFGDYFTIETTTRTGRQGIIRDYEINSEAELEDFKKENPDQAEELKASRHHYFNWLAPYGSKQITAFWSQYDYPFDITQVSEWSVSQLETENLVYMGQTKSMGLLKEIFNETFPQYSYRSQRIIRSDPKTKKISYYSDVITNSDKNIDYTIVSKITLPTGNEMRLFLSDQDVGAITTLHYFTQNDSVEAFYERHQLSKEDDFLALFKVTGWHRKSYEMEFVLLDKK